MTSLSAIVSTEPNRSLQLQNALYRILDVAIEADYAVLGNIQLFDHKRRTLNIVAQRGFDLAFHQHFKDVRVEDNCACGRAFAQKRRIMISDVARDAGYAPHLAIAQSNGFRAVQSTPLFHEGVLLGVLSTHFPDVHHLSANAIATLDECATDLVTLLSASPS